MNAIIVTSDLDTQKEVKKTVIVWFFQFEIPKVSKLLPISCSSRRDIVFFNRSNKAEKWESLVGVDESRVEEVCRRAVTWNVDGETWKFMNFSWFSTTPLKLSDEVRVFKENSTMTAMLSHDHHPPIEKLNFKRKLKFQTILHLKFINSIFYFQFHFITSCDINDFFIQNSFKSIFI